MTKAIYAGSFDPFHKGHMNIVQRASKMFDQLFVVVANNEDKNHRAPLQERFEALKVKDFPENVMVLQLKDGLLVNLARQMHIDTLVRSYRNDEDLAYEEDMAKRNRNYQSHIKTVLLQAEEELRNVASSNLV